MKYKIVTSQNFLRDLKTCKKRGYNINKLWDVIDKLQNGTPLPPSCRPHKLSGNHEGEDFVCITDIARLNFDN